MRKRICLAKMELLISRLPIASESCHFFTVTNISVDRFLAVYIANKYRSTVTMKKAKLVVVFLWLIAIAVMIIFILKRTVYFIVAMIVFGCLLITSCNYIAISRMLQRRHALSQSNNNIQTGQQRRNIFTIGRYKRTVTTMLYVYIAFLLCYLPYLCFTIIKIHFGNASKRQGIYFITPLNLVFLNSTLNPFLYYWRIPEVRLQIKQLFGCGATRGRSARVLEL